jgi:hypothetical protein
MRDESPHDSQSQRPGVNASAYVEQEAPGTVTKLDLDVLRAVFPDWRIGGSLGYWFAVRGGLVAHDGPRSLLHCCLNASTLLELAEQLCLQEYLDGLSDQELEKVWQRIELPRPTEQATS